MIIKSSIKIEWNYGQNEQLNMWLEHYSSEIKFRWDKKVKQSFFLFICISIRDVVNAVNTKPCSVTADPMPFSKFTTGVSNSWLLGKYEKDCLVKAKVVRIYGFENWIVEKNSSNWVIKHSNWEAQMDCTE